MKRKLPIRKIIIAIVGISILVVGGTFAYSKYDSYKQKKAYENRVDTAIDLFNKIKDGIIYIETQNKQYTTSMFAKIDNGTFIEEEDTKAFNQMYADIDKKIKSLKIEEYCDSIGGQSLDTSNYPEYSNQVSKMEELFSDLRSIGYRIGGFSTRDKEWEHEPWCSMNTANYHNMNGISKEISELEKIGAGLNGIRKNTYTPHPKENIDELSTLGVKYYNGEGVERDAAKAIEYFTKAAGKGDAHSMYNISCIIEDEDPSDAHKWCMKAAVAGDTQAMIAIAKDYYDMINPNHRNKTENDKTLAKKWYDRAANYGNTDGLYNMGLNYYLGWYDKKNDKLASTYFKIGLIYNDAHCANCYGMMQDSREEQAKYYQLALKFDPDFLPAKQNLQKLGY